MYRYNNNEKRRKYSTNNGIQTIGSVGIERIQSVTGNENDDVDGGSIVNIINSTYNQQNIQMTSKSIGLQQNRKTKGDDIKVIAFEEGQNDNHNIGGIDDDDSEDLFGSHKTPYNHDE